MTVTIEDLEIRSVPARLLVGSQVARTNFAMVVDQAVELAERRPFAGAVNTSP